MNLATSVSDNDVPLTASKGINDFREDLQLCKS